MREKEAVSDGRKSWKIFRDARTEQEKPDEDFAQWRRFRSLPSRVQLLPESRRCSFRTLHDPARCLFVTATRLTWIHPRKPGTPTKCYFTDGRTFSFSHVERRENAWRSQKGGDRRRWSTSFFFFLFHWTMLENIFSSSVISSTISTTMLLLSNRNVINLSTPKLGKPFIS